MGQGALSKPAVQWWLSLNFSKSPRKKTGRDPGLRRYTLHLRLSDGRPILFWVLVLVGAFKSGTVWAGLGLIHHHHNPGLRRCMWGSARIREFSIPVELSSIARAEFHVE